MNKDLFIKNVMEQLNIEDKALAERGTHIVLNILSYRLTEEESENVKDQLPEELKRLWCRDVWISSLFRLSGKRLKYRHLVELMSIVDNEIKRDNLPLHTESLLKAVFHTLKEQITPGETKDVIAQLPHEIRDFYKAA